MADVLVNRSNKLGVPLILAQSLTSDGTNSIVSFNRHVNMSDEFTGLILVKLPMVVATSTQPVFFATIGSSGSNTALYMPDGTQALVSDVTSTTAPTYHLCVYDSTSNRLQLLA